MTNLFIGGSRRITRLNAEIRQYLDDAIEGGYSIIIGDANGADKAVQHYLLDRGYDNVELFCVEGKCRNNAGGWKVRDVSVDGSKKGFDYYSAKDKEMALEATQGFMLWDGESRGTLTQIYRLLIQEKVADVYIVPNSEFITVKGKVDWERLISNCSEDMRQKTEKYVRSESKQTLGIEQGRLL